MLITIDFETFSRASLKKQGVHVYARHPSTRIICLAYGPGLDCIDIWVPGSTPPNSLFDQIYSGALIEAHNVQFERAIWESICVAKLGWPKIDPEQWRCTLAGASRLALPRGLEDVAKVLGLSEQKDMVGSEALKKVCKPDKKGVMNQDPALLNTVYDYCKQDVRTEIALSDTLEDMPESELILWQLDQEINNRGLLIDKVSLKHAMVVVDKCQTESVENLFTLADGEVTSVTQVDRVRKWIGERLPGGPPETLSKAIVENLLKRGDLPPEVRSMLILRQEGAKSSLGKLQAMVDRMNDDGKVRGNQVYHGAATGRWAGSGLQIQNFPRPMLKQSEIDFILDDLLPTEDPKIIKAFFGDVPAAISSCLRGLICSEPGSSFYVCDFAAIEARVLAWLADQEDLVQAFLDGVDVYKYMANKIFEVPIEDIDKDQRFLGKSAILGAGYSMGYRKFVQSCLLVGKVVVSSLMAKKTIKTYREANPKIVQLWRDCNRECIECIKTGEPQTINQYLSVDMHRGMMRIKLPSGRYLHYHNPKVVKVPAPWTQVYVGKIWMPENRREALELADVEVGDFVDGRFEGCKITPKMAKYLKSKNIRMELEKPKEEVIEQITFWGVDSQTKRWSKKRTYGGSLVENITQGVARDLLAEAMLRVEEAGYPIVCTIHDEIVSEVVDGFGDLEEYESLMKIVPDWASGCPVDVEGLVSKRYCK